MRSKTYRKVCIIWRREWLFSWDDEIHKNRTTTYLPGVAAAFFVCRCGADYRDATNSSPQRHAEEAGGTLGLPPRRGAPVRARGGVAGSDTSVSGQAVELLSLF